MYFRCSFFIGCPRGSWRHLPRCWETAGKTTRTQNAKPKKRGNHHDSFDHPSSVPQGQRSGSRWHLCSWSAEQLRRQFFRWQLRGFRYGFCRRQQLYHPVRQPAFHSELPDHRFRPGDAGRRQLRGHPGGVRQQGCDERGPGHQLGLGCGHPDLDVPPA